MAVSKMSFISMIGPMQQIDEVVGVCGQSAVFHPDSVFSFYSDTEGFRPFAEENPYSEPLQKLSSAVYNCGGKTEIVNIKEFVTSQSKLERYVNYFVSNVDELVKERRDLYRELENMKNEIKIIKNFYGLNRSFKDVLSCQYIKARLGKIPLENFKKLPELAEQSEKKGINLVFFAFSQDADYQWGMYFADEEHREDIDRLFSSLYFEEVEIEPYDRTPFEQVNYFQSSMNDIYKKIEIIDKRLKEFWQEQSGKCHKFYSKLMQLSSCFEIKSYSAIYHKSFILVGWVPEEELKALCEKLDKIKNVEYTTEQGKNILKHLPPVKLRNNKIFKPFEFFVEMYGMPSYNEIDPTAFVAITYTVLFGIMFADVGQGLLVSLIGFLMWKFKKMKLGQALIPCGISSAIFGFIFGSVFGFEHVLDGFYRVVFGLKEKPIEVMDPQTINYVIYAAVGIGVVLLMLSMCLSIYACIKRRDYGKAIFGPNGLCGLVFYSSVVFMALDMLMLHTGLVNSIFAIIFILLPLGLLMCSELLIKLTNGESNWKPEKWGEFFAQGFFELFETVLSYVTNTMSFLRVGAFVLVHAGMMMVVFTIANMIGGRVGYISAIIIGNIIVAGLEALLAGIQVLRLEFYEMFGKFFDGQGRVYSPVKVVETTN